MLARVSINSLASTALVINQKVFPLSESFASILRMSSSRFNEFTKKIIEDKSLTTYSLEEVELLAPVVDTPYTIYCIGKNYLDHVNEVKGTAMGQGVPTIPIVFNKAISSVNTPYGDIPLPSESTSTQIDYEGELAVVIGMPGNNIKPEDAFKHVFGVTIVNDVSARDKQKKHLQWLLGKSLDGFCPIGPHVTPLENVLADLTGSGLSIQTTVNDELRQNGNTNSMIFNIPTLISTISEDITLQTGDIIATGTPKGVGAGFDPPKYLANGDTVVVSISKLGKIENRVVDLNRSNL